MNLTTEVELPVVLPGIHHEDNCVRRLVDELLDTAGISRAHVRGASAASAGILCIHYDPEQISLQRVRELATSMGVGLGQQYGHLSVELGSAVHARKARMIAGQLLSLPGIIEATTSPAGGVSIEYDRAKTSEAEVRLSLDALGVGKGAPAPYKKPEDQHEGHNHKEGQDHGHSHGGILGANSELIFSLACGLLLIVGFAVEKLELVAPPWIPTSLSTLR